MGEGGGWISKLFHFQGEDDETFEGEEFSLDYDFNPYLNIQPVGRQ